MNWKAGDIARIFLCGECTAQASECRECGLAKYDGKVVSIVDV